MELSREIYQLITQNVSSRTDLCTLARVSKPFRRATERALYNTLYMKDPNATIKLCTTLVSAPRLAALVDALTVFAGADENSFQDSDEDEDSEEERQVEEISLPEGYWETLAHALRCVVQLRFFNLHVDGVTDKAWILRDSTFRLLSFHCDLAWDTDLVEFLNRQDRLHDLYLADYAISNGPPESIEPEEATEGEAEDGHQPQSSVPLPASSLLKAEALSTLSTLECSFIDAIATFANGRPLTRVKTCFSREDTAGKRGELERLCEGLRMTSTRVRSLDLADSAYTEDFSLSVLGALVPRLPELRYLGTLVLPVGLERLQFYGLLRRLRRLRTVELEVSDWEPQPTPQALRALASELRLYCPSVTCTVFVQEFERVVVRVVNGLCAVDFDASADNLWRDISIV